MSEGTSGEENPPTKQPRSLMKESLMLAFLVSVLSLLSIAGDLGLLTSEKYPEFDRFTKIASAGMVLLFVWRMYWNLVSMADRSEG